VGASVDTVRPGETACVLGWWHMWHIRALDLPNVQWGRGYNSAKSTPIRMQSSLVTRPDSGVRSHSTYISGSEKTSRCTPRGRRHRSHGSASGINTPPRTSRAQGPPWRQAVGKASPVSKCRWGDLNESCAPLSRPPLLLLGQLLQTFEPHLMIFDLDAARGVLQNRIFRYRL
jgi:hypothetical protein